MLLQGIKKGNWLNFDKFSCLVQIKWAMSVLLNRSESGLRLLLDGIS